MSRVSRGFKILWWLIKFAFVALIAFVCGFLFWRIFSSSTPKSLQTISVNEAIYDAYSNDGELLAFYQEQNSTTRAEHNAGYFSVVHTAFVPEANQIQVVLRYNNSTIRHLVEDKGLSETPERSEDLFDISLFFSVDLTPDNTEDNATVSDEGTRVFRCPSRLVAKEEKNLYNYRKFVFDLDVCGEDLSALLESGELLAVYADIYYTGDMDLEKEAYGTLCLYDYITKKEDIKLSLTDIKAIEGWKEDE